MLESPQFGVCLVCVYYCRTYYKAVRGGGGRRVEDVCYERRRAEACVDESAHHALANAGAREIVGKNPQSERRRGSRRGVREGACIGGATMLQPWTCWEFFFSRKIVCLRDTAYEPPDVAAAARPRVCGLRHLGLILSLSIEISSLVPGGK